MDRMLDIVRTEKKYLISLLAAHQLANTYSQVLHRDAHSLGEWGYPVRSLYFDTPDDRDYSDKSDGLDPRRKIRLRTYSLQASSVKLELKEKVKNLQRKRSLTLSRENAIRIQQGDYECLLQLNSEFAEEVYRIMVLQVYRPKCLVEYDRLAFSEFTNDTRITLDANLRASESCLDLFSNSAQLLPVASYDDVTLEVKYNHFLLSYIKNLVSLCDKSQLSVSKYCIARSLSGRDMHSFL